MTWRLTSSFLLCALTPSLFACAGVWSGTSAKDAMQMTSETAIIVWDPVGKVEHFVRKAEFQSDAAKLGFIVPTPTLPKLTRFNEQIFEVLDRVTHPVNRVTQTGYRFVFLGGGPTDAAASAGIPEDDAGVIPLPAIQIGSYEASVLKSTDAAQLAKWLSENGFKMRPALQTWLDGYVKKGWYLTAFKLKKGTNPSTADLPAVRLTFSTPTAIYPYQEPDDGPNVESRSLRLYFITIQNVEATVNGKPWSAKKENTYFADYQVINSLREPMTFPMGKTGIPAPWVTTFVDDSKSRKGLGDITFKVNPGPMIVPKTKTITVDMRKDVAATTWLPLGLGAIIGLVWAIRSFWKMWHSEAHLEQSSNEV